MGFSQRQGLFEEDKVCQTGAKGSLELHEVLPIDNRPAFASSEFTVARVIVHCRTTIVAGIASGAIVICWGLL